jgi:hypothetical protein
MKRELVTLTFKIPRETMDELNTLVDRVVYELGAEEGIQLRPNRSAFLLKWVNRGIKELRARAGASKV